MPGGMQQALKSACSGIAGCVKQIFEDIRIQREQSRIYNEARLQTQQQMQYVPPMEMTLTPLQIADINSQFMNHPVSTSADILLEHGQVLDIVDRFIYQATVSNDTRTLQNLRNVLIPGGLEFNLGFLRVMHKEVFDVFISKYHPELTYASVTPLGTFFVITDKGFGFYYRIYADKPLTRKQYFEEFQRFSNTSDAYNLRDRYGLNSFEVTFDSRSKDLILFFR